MVDHHTHAFELWSSFLTPKNPWVFWERKRIFLISQDNWYSYLALLVFISVGKIPENLSPAPTPKFGDFQGFPPKKSPNFEFPPSPKYPQIFKSLNPVPNRKIWGFSGMNSKRSPNLGLSPSPKFPRKFRKPCPCPQIFGDFWGKPQKSPKFRLCLSSNYTYPNLIGASLWWV